MDMKKTAKKIAALVAGTTMLGATIMGATALDLSNYPAPFVTNGVFSGKIVVGAKAATSDVVGAIDIAASLQADAVTTKDISVAGSVGKASVSGDASEFKTGADVITLLESIGTVKGTFTASDLAALKAGVLESGSSSTPVKQYLKFDNTTMYVTYTENTDDDVVGDFLYVPSDTTLFDYHMEFTEGAESAYTSTTDHTLEDLESEVVTILGAPYTIVDATASGNQISLTFLGGQVADVLRDGETKTYTIDGKDYEVTAVFISDAGTAGSAKLSVNGVMTKELESGDTQILGADVTVGVQSVMTNNREGIVEFYLGANKLKMVDTNYNNDNFVGDGSVEVKGDSVSNADLVIKATNVSTTGLKLNYIKYRVTTDEERYIAAGKGLKESLGTDNSNALLTDTFDIKYAGLVGVETTEVKFDAISDHSYEMTFVNSVGDKYTFPLLTKKAGTFKWGNQNDNFIFKEYVNSSVTVPASAVGCNNSNTFIEDNDYFMVSDRATGTGDDKAVVSVLRYVSINTADSTVTFKDLASGGDIVTSYTGTPGVSATGTLIVEGASHIFYIGNSNEDYQLSMDLDATGAIVSGAAVYPDAKGGKLYMNLGNASQTVATADIATGIFSLGLTQVNLTMQATSGKFDESSEGSETATVTFTPGSGNTVDISVDPSTTTTPVALALEQDPSNDDYQRGYNKFGAWFELYNPSSTSSSSELTVQWPTTQKYAQVFVTAGSVEVKEGAATSGSKVTSASVNPIAVGLAVLDTEAPAIGAAKMIIVGGPCVNVKAAELMGNPADCAAGFTPGKAVIKLFADKNALLVAGYSAQDTLGASYVIADAKDYKLSGTEVEVVVADLKNIDVKVVK